MGAGEQGQIADHDQVQVFKQSDEYKFLNREMNGISRNEKACKVHEVSLILYGSPNMCFSAWHIVGA